jgi:hypothetical protein
MHDAKLVHAELVSIAVQRDRLQVRQARLLVLAEQLEIWRQFDCAHIYEYLERYCDLHPRTAREYVRVARALAALPLMRAKLEAEEIRYSTARELTRIAMPETEAEWLQKVEGMTAREVEEEVAGRERGDRPHDPKDMAATMYHLLGVDPNTVLHDNTGRPHQLVIGRPIEGILA